MNETHIEPTPSAENGETAVLQTHEEQLTTLFNQGWRQLVNQRWQQAEKTFAQIEASNAHYEQDGLPASYLREKAQYEREAEAAFRAGELEAALIFFKKADNFENVREVYELLTIQELETKAERLSACGNYQSAAWIYDHLLTKFSGQEKETNWQIKRENCWEAELLPYFQIGLQALERNEWRTAYNAFARVMAIDPYFRQDGRSAAVLSEIARKEVITLADQGLRQGQVQQALDAYREIGHLARIANVVEFLRLRQQEEIKAQQLEADGKWQAAAASYKNLRTLYYDEDGRAQWQAAANRCLEESQLKALYTQAIEAFDSKQWSEAQKLFSQILAIRPDYQPGEQSANKLYRTACWRYILSRFAPDSNNPPPQLPTGKFS